MAFLRISRPALTCLLLVLALSRQAALEEKGAKAKCKNPSGYEGKVYYDGCSMYSCVKAKGKAGIWVESPAVDVCCVQNGTLHETGTILEETYPNPCSQVLLKCELIDDVPSIRPWVYDICPAPYEMIEEKLYYLSEKLNEVHQAVEDLDCGGYDSGSEDKVILIAGGYSNNHEYISSVELYNPKTSSSCFLPSLPASRFDPVSSGLRVCGGNIRDCVEFSGGTWTTVVQLTDDRMGSSGWESSQGLVIMGGYDSLDTAEIVRDGYSEELFTLSPPRVFACSIPDYDSDTVVLTGGLTFNQSGGYTLNIVERYDLNGFVESLPYLNTDRVDHGCGYYYKDGERVLLVAGGYNINGSAESWTPLHSTEILLPGYNYWTYSASLPVPVASTASVSLHNIYLIGNSADYTSSKTVWEWSSEAEEWTISGYIKDDRASSGAALVSLSSGIMDFCYESSPSTSGPYRDQEEDEPMMKIHAKMAEAKKKKDLWMRKLQ